MSEEAEFCYVAAQPGMPGYCAAAVDRPEYKKDTAKDIAGWIRRGFTVSRVSNDEAGRGLNEYLAEKKRRASTSNPEHP